MRHALYPGSFDPFTNGHLDIVERGLNVFDKITIAILKNSSKKGLFTPDERVELTREVFGNDDRIEVESFEGLLVDFCRDRNISIILRGLRAVSDFDYEHAMSLMNRQLLDNLETVFLMSSSENSFISSTMVKEVASLGGDVREQVPPVVYRWLSKRYNT